MVTPAVTIGQYEYSLDAKNRLVIPPRYREALYAEQGSHFILAQGLDKCIWLFLPSQWQNLLQDMQETSKGIKNKATARALRRSLFGSAVECPLDDQGRALVPQRHKDHALLKKDVMIVGAGNKAEIWDRARWNAYMKKEAAPSFEKLAKDIDL